MGQIVDVEYIELRKFKQIRDIMIWMRDNPRRGFIDIKPEADGYLLVTIKSADEILRLEER